MNSMANIPAIVLCGGFGTRLKSVSGDLPKPMVDVANRPFLEHVLNYLQDQGIRKVTLAVSYRREAIMNYFGHQYQQLSIDYSIESEPLGTGGAIKLALNNQQSHSPVSLIINGDTFIEYQLKELYSELKETQADMVMCLKPMSDTSRYGRVVTTDNRVVEFKEKEAGESGYINAGVYLISDSLAETFPTNEEFSFEKDLLEPNITQLTINSAISHGYFIDIGIPEDYQKAQYDFAQ